MADTPTAWRQITCDERNRVWAEHGPDLRAGSTVTDLSGTHWGTPYLWTEWWDTDDRPVLRDQRWPGHDGEPDTRPCQHYIRQEEATDAA